MRTASRSNAPAYHIRHYINKDDGIGPRFTWDLPKATKLKPYGCWRFKEFIETAKLQGIPSYIFVNESELDNLTCWLHGVPASAIGGNQGWRDEWTSLFLGFDKLIIAQEPGSPGEEMVKHIAQAFHELGSAANGKIPEILACPFSEDVKDMNALHLSVGGDKAKFQEILKGLVSRAIPVKPILDGRSRPGGSRAQT